MMRTLIPAWVSALLPVLVFGLGVTACTTTTNLAGVPEAKPSTKAPPENRARIHTELAALYYQQGSLKTALAEIDTALRIDADYAPAYDMRGLVHMQLGENREAASDFQRAISLAPTDPDLRNNYGLFLCEQGNYQAGLAQLAQAWSNPLYATPALAYENASRCAAASGNQTLANEYHQKAQRLDGASSSVRSPQTSGSAR